MIEKVVEMDEREKEILSKIDEKSTVKLLQKLIRTVTTNPPGEEIKLAKWVATFLKKSSLEVELLPFDKRRANVVARIKGSGKKPGLIFSAHFDTVPAGEIPWKFDPFAGVVHENKVYGRGAADMKGGMAAMLKATQLLSEAEVEFKGDLILALTSGETSNCIGAKKLVEGGKINDAGAILISEPTGLNVFTAEKGALWIKAKTFGKTAHGSMPQHGENAIVKMAEFLSKLENFKFGIASHPLLGSPTLSVGTIKGGVNINVIPDSCEAELDIRLLPEQDPSDVLAQLKRLSKNEVNFEIIDFKKSVETDTTSPFVDICLKSVADVIGKKPEPMGVSYFTDGAIIANRLNIPMAIIGPADAEMSHQPNECVEIPKLIDAVKIYCLIALRTLR